MGPGENAAQEDRVDRNIRSLTRWRLIFVLLLLVVPAGLYALFERQARRLDALGRHGAITTATVTSVNGQYVGYEYAIGNDTYTWSVAQRDAPYDIGEKFPVLYLPEDAALSRPDVDPAKATAEAASNRSFSGKMVSGVSFFLAINVMACDFSLRRLRRRGSAELTDPRAYRMRLAFAGATLLPLLLLVFGWHGKEALQRGESLWPVFLGGALVLAVLGRAMFYVWRAGPSQVAARSASLMEWVAPLAAAVAVLRVLAWLAGWP